jgi:hypothetical protein
VIVPTLEYVNLKQDDPCPKCKVGFMEHHQHRFSTERGPNLPDCDWLECCECDFKTDPE